MLSGPRRSLALGFPEIQFEGYMAFVLGKIIVELDRKLRLFFGHTSSGV